MPDLWCDSCQDYHDEDDDFDEPEEEGMPRINYAEVYAACSQAPGQAVYIQYDSWLRDMQRTPARTPTVYQYDMWGAVSPPINAEQAAYSFLNTQTILFDIPNTVGLTHSQNLLTAFANEHKFLSDIAWCKHREGGCIVPFPYVQKFVPIVSPDSYWDNGQVVGEETDCPHCAYVKAQQITVENGAGKPHVLACNQAVQALPSNIMPSVEVIGEPVATNTATIKDVTEDIPLCCSNCGRINHTLRTCDNPPKVHLKIGVEIEGRWLDWDNLDERRRRDGLGGYSDPSVRNSATGATPYELQTVPGNLRQACQQLVDFYPDETDFSCGMHVHVSFHACDVTLLNNKHFFQYFRARMKAWGERMNLSPTSQFFRRLNGDNDYCFQNGELPHSINNGDRYMQLNFTSWSEHGTVECRLLPMFRRASLGVSAIQELIDIYETYLHSPQQFGFEELAGEAKLPPVSLAPIKLDTIYMSAPTGIVHKDIAFLEMHEHAEVSPGHTRVAFPNNAALTLQQIAQAVKKRQAA